MVGCSAGTINNLWSSIEDRHRRFGLAMPLGGAGEFKRLYKAVAAVKGTPSRIMFPIGVHHIKRLLELVGLTECQERDVLVTVLGTVVCMRVVELTFLQVCDILWDLDAAFHIMYLGTLAVHIYRRKQDTARKGLYARVGLAANAAWDLAHRMLRHAERYGLRVSPECTKRESPGAGSLSTLFSLFLHGQGRTARDAESAAGHAGRDQESGTDRRGHAAL